MGELAESFRPKLGTFFMRKLMYRHGHLKNGAKITVLEEDENWILGTMPYGDPQINFQINIFCKSCMWYVGYGLNVGHSRRCLDRNKEMNQLFLKKALFCASKEL